MVHHLLVLIIITSINIGQATAATPVVDKAVKALGSLSSDAPKLKAYCVAFNEYADSGDNEAKQKTANEKMSSVLNSFGPRFQGIWQVYQESDPSSADGQALDTAFAKLDEQCES